MQKAMIELTEKEFRVLLSAIETEMEKTARQVIIDKERHRKRLKTLFDLENKLSDKWLEVYFG